MVAAGRKSRLTGTSPAFVTGWRRRDWNSQTLRGIANRILITDYCIIIAKSQDGIGYFVIFRPIFRSCLAFEKYNSENIRLLHSACLKMHIVVVILEKCI